MNKTMTFLSATIVALTVGGPLAAATISLTAPGGTLDATLVATGPAAWDKVDQDKSIALPKGAAWTAAPEVLPSATFGISPEGGDPCRNACSPFYGGVIGTPSTKGAPGWETTPFFTVFDPKETLHDAADPSVPVWVRMAVLSFAAPQKAISFLWGTPDDANVVELLLGDDLVGSFWGSEFDWFSKDIVTSPGAGAALLKLSGLTFDSVRFGTWAYKGSFEISNITSEPAAVPVPPAFAALFGSLGLLLALARRRRSASA